MNKMNEFDALQFQEVKELVAKRCRFSLGNELLLKLVPSYEYLWIKQETQRTQEAIDLTIRYGVMPLLGLHDVTSYVEDAKRDKTLRAFELRRISAQGNAVKAALSYHKAKEIDTPNLDELLDSFGDIKALCKQIEACINANDEIMDHASSTLAQLRKAKRACEGDISKEVQRFIASNGTKLMDTITTTRNNRICVLMKASEKNSVRGFIHGESASGQTAYVEPEGLFQLNNRLASLISREQDEIERILFELSQAVKSYAYAILANQETFALLDLYFTKAEYAIQQNGCMVQVVENGTHCYIKAARHPLIDQNVVVSNTYEIKDPYRSLLITGSNTGGKTVTLKTIGLFACMAQCGLPVLAEQAILPFFTNIFVDIGDDQSIQESLSTFSSHVSKLAYICDHVSASSLVLLDELGSGTDPKEGESLAVAILDELRSSHAFVIATTHYSALKAYAKQSDDVLISSVEFDVEEMKPTYHYLEGISGKSNAFAIARRYHMKERVLQKAQELKDQTRTDHDFLIEKLEEEQASLHEKKQKMEETLSELQRLREEALQEKIAFEQTKEKKLAEVKEQYANELEERLLQAEAIIDELKALSKDAKPHIISELAHQLHDIELTKEETKEETESKEFEAGDYVCLTKLNYFGEILEIQKDKVIVNVNGMRMNVKKKDLAFAPKPKKKAKEKGYGSPKSKSFSMELNVIGMTVSEALPVIDKYLDNAVLAKVFNVRIIHGVGTGALRKGVHTYLKKDPKVEDFRMGGQGEGGLGATVVALKNRGKKHG